MLTVLVLSALPLLLIAAAMKDAATMTIPNWISLAIVGAFLVVSPFALSPAEIGSHMLTGLAMLAVCFAMFSLNWVGGGDAKLVAAASVWFGWAAMPEFLLWTALAGGGLSLALIGARRAAPYLPFAIGEGAVARLLLPKGDIPYGLAICAGGLAAFPGSAIFLAVAGG